MNELMINKSMLPQHIWKLLWDVCIPEKAQR